MNKMLAASAALLLLGPISVSAATYDPGALTFVTQKPQSVWAPGDALEVSDTKFIGETWNAATQPFGGIAGEASKVIPNPTYASDYAAWEFCNSITIGGICAFPPPPQYVTTIDTRTGFEAKLESSGKVGFDVDYMMSAGSFDATVDFGATAVLPDAVKRGEVFQISADSVFTGGQMSVQSPTVEASVSLVADLKADAVGTICFAGLGCTASKTELVNVDIDSELISVNPDEVSYLKGFLPPGVELTTPLGNQTIATLKVGLVNGVPTVYPEGPGIPDVVATIGTDLGSIEVEAPLLDKNNVGGKVGDSLVVNATGEFLEIDVDIDGLPLMPKGGFSAALGPVDISVDLFDIDAGPSMDIFQDLKLTPKLMVTLAMSEAVEIGGQLVDTFTGAWDSLPAMKIFKKTTFVPTFFIEAFLVSKTGLQFGLEFSAEFLKAAASFDLFGLPVANLSLGPLFSKEFAFDPAWAKLAVYESAFGVGGSNQIEARSFTLTPVDEEMAPVPLPPTILMLLAALGGLAAGKRRRKPSAAGQQQAMAA